jgi:predicted membrane channel-forming protein YqfA (hemolysin III family)
MKRTSHWAITLLIIGSIVFKASVTLRQCLGAKAQLEVEASHPVTPYFLKRRESYKFIYLNKYLIVAFMSMYIFLCVVKCSYILLCK